MAEEFDKAKVLERVRKMLRLANDSAAAEGERDNALRMAHSTLAKYNLSLAEAEAHGQAPKEQRVNNVLNVRDYAWMRSVADHIAKLFFCEYFYIRDSQTKYARYYFIGKESNARIALEMASYVMASIDREAQDVAIRNGDTAKGTFWRSFCKGAAYKVKQRCMEMILAAMEPLKEKTPGTSLVLASVYQLEAEGNMKYMADSGIKVRTVVSRQRVPLAQAFSHGSRYGETVNLQTNLIKGK